MLKRSTDKDNVYLLRLSNQLSLGKQINTFGSKTKTIKFDGCCKG